MTQALHPNAVELDLVRVDRLAGELYTARAGGRPGVVLDANDRPITGGLPAIADELASLVSSESVSEAIAVDARRATNLKNLFKKFGGDPEADVQARLRETEAGRDALVAIDKGSRYQVIDIDKGVFASLGADRGL